MLNLQFIADCVTTEYFLGLLKLKCNDCGNKKAFIVLLIQKYNKS